MERLIFATGNKDKMKEIRMILADTDYEILSMKEAGIDVDIVEDGSTFEENAIIKAKAISKIAGCLVLADDSGLEVDAMDGAPGIYSARFEGVDTPYSVKNKIIMDKLEGLPKEERTARFVCAIAAAWPDGRVETRRGTIEGTIAHEPAGENGFGYDPIFFVPEYGKTTAELDPEEKNKISHRGKALRMIKEVL
ncbi:MAG: XTP/dITP diphosphatase [Clostridium sp.]|nr:XTP/dITP diphosphatase [Clostridium sp.]MCM1207765.1 XTP/dITP diphosphatase [Ruminococcus sp.]